MLKEAKEYGIGNTPVIELPDVNGNRMLLKLEYKNFLSNIKVRPAYWIVRNLPKEADDCIIIESTSGNLGYTLGYFIRESGRDFLCLVDSSTAKKKLDRLNAAGISYTFVEKEEGYDLRSSRIRKAECMMKYGNYYWTNQYDNPDGIKAHEETTGPEIWEQTEGKVTHCVCAIGSGGTVIGTGKYLKRMSPQIKMVGVEPYGSTIYGTVEAEYINVGAGLVGKPGNILRNPNIVDISYTICDAESIHWTVELNRKYKLNVGVTSGMAYAGALKIAETTTGATIVVVAPDGDECYEEYLGQQ